MGGVSSVYIRPVAATTSSNDQPVVTESVAEAGNQLVEWRLQEMNSGNGGVLEMKIVAEDREAEMGRTIQFLAEENVRLKQINDSMKSQLGDAYEPSSIQPEFFEESEEEKIKRLERALLRERKEKWDAISNAEIRRVNLINCQKLLSHEENLRKALSKELDDLKARVNDLGSERPQTNSVESVVERNPDLGNELTAFRNQMQQLREARHKAISAKSEEMKKLREELANERALREKLERKLHVLPNTAETHSQHEHEIKSIENELKAVRNENAHLNDNLVRLKLEQTQLSSKCLQLQNDLSEALRKNERLLRDFDELETEKIRVCLKLQELDDGQKILRSDYESEKEEMVKQMLALKDIARISRQMLVIRQNQVDDLKAKLNVIEETMHENNTTHGGELKVEYEKQLANIKALKELYEERVHLMESERLKLIDKITDDAKAMDDMKEELSDLSMKYDMAAEEVDQERQKNLGLDAELSACVAQAQNWHRELTCINSLLTQMLLGPNPETPEHLDRLADLLQQNHDLIAQITNCEDCTDVAAALPKLLLDLITQVEDREKREVVMLDVAGSMTDSTDTISEQSGVLPIVSYKNAKIFKAPEIESKDNGILDFVMPANKLNPVVQEIVTNLPKVWKVLTELLSHHSLVERQSGEPTGQERTCYKRIETPNGPRSVISVSNTFIRLKELILEKKSLTQEVCRLRHLNSHLETRLEDQEKRLSSVQSELHKTWGVVGRMRAQHQQLHNHEKILRYELQEKRIMLSELRLELEHCKDKWERARRKNNESETECRKLRKEFAARKFRDLGLDASRDSGESGFSDDQADADRSSTPSPIDFRTQPEPVVQSLAVEALPDMESRALLEDATVSQWPPILEETDNLNENVSNFTLDDELRVNISPLGVDLPPVEEESVEVSTEGVLEEPVVEVKIVPETVLVKKPTTEAVTAEIASVEPAMASEFLDDGQNQARDARALRLQRLEEQCALLVRKVDITTHKSNYLSNRLEELHDHYGGGSSPSTSLQSDESFTDVTKAPPTPPPLPPIPPQLPPTPPPLPPNPPEMTVDERLAARAERLRRLEEQCSSLHSKVSNTVNRGNELSAKLTVLHEGCVNAENRASSSTDQLQEENNLEENESESEKNV